MKTPSSDHQMIFEIKKSKFIVYIAKIASKEQAQTFIKNKLDPQANHNCWAYKLDTACKYSDDGEPSGTAGKPILNAIINNDFDKTVVLVTRFFGGIKLGAGRLIRAYSSVTSDTLKETLFQIIKEEMLIQLVFKLKYSGKIYHFLKTNQITIFEEEQENLSKKLKIRYGKDQHANFKDMIQSITHGSARWDIIEK
jgi:uncharacterized YigZ family protein